MLLSLGVLVVAVAIPETVLRMAGFRFAPGIQFGFPRPQQLADFAPDERLFWKLRPLGDPAATKFAGNSLGFPGGEFEIPKPEGVRRILFLGDSCTFLGYPKIVQARLDATEAQDGEAARARYETVSLAIPGYTSHQGLVAARLHGARLEPDAVVVYFGWNDHWLAYGEPDSRKVVRAPDVADGQPSAGGMRAEASRRLRLVQAMDWLRAKIARTYERSDALRVSPPEYASNLLEIQRLFAARGTPVVFVTAPTTLYRLGVPPYLLLLEFVKDADSAIELHRAYNRIVRDVAGRTSSPLLDLEAECEAREDLGTLFLADGIHFTEAGEAWAGERVAQAVLVCLRPAAPR